MKPEQDTDYGHIFIAKVRMKIKLATSGRWSLSFLLFLFLYCLRFYNQYRQL